MVDLNACLQRLALREVQGIQRVTAREAADLEFKRDLSLATFRKSLKTVAAFSNCKGGWVVFGVANNPRDLVGIGNAEIDDGQLSEQLIQSICPVPAWEMQYFEAHGRRFAVFEVHASERPPAVAIRDVSAVQGEDPSLRQGVIYTRRRGQTSPITGAEFTQILRIRDDVIEKRVFQFLSKGREIGFEKAIVAGKQGDGQADAQGMTFYVPASAAREMRIIDRARLVDEMGAPAYELVGNVQLVAPGDVDPRNPMRSTESVNAMREAIVGIFGEQFPWAFSHLKKAATHLGFWRDEDGDRVNTGREPLTNTTMYFQAGRNAIVDFAQRNPNEFVDVVASAATRRAWRDRDQGN